MKKKEKKTYHPELLSHTNVLKKSKLNHNEQTGKTTIKRKANFTTITNVSPPETLIERF